MKVALSKEIERQRLQTMDIAVLVKNKKNNIRMRLRVLLLLMLASLVKTRLKDGAYYCYCACVLRISRYSDFLSLMLTNTGIFLRGLKLSGESRS